MDKDKVQPVPDEARMGVPWETYQKMEREYDLRIKELATSMKKMIDMHIDVKLPDHFTEIAKLVEQGILTDEEAMSACDKALKKHRATLNALDQIQV